MRRLGTTAVIVGTVIVLSLLAFWLVSSASGQSPTTTTTTETTEPTVVKREVRYPKRRVVRRSKFAPWARPTRNQVYKIINIEAARTGASAARLRCRIAGESGFRWWIVNGGGYGGLGQFATETFYRGMRSIGSRRVLRIDTRMTKRRKIVIKTYSDGSVKRFKSSLIPVKVVHVYRGTIPRYPNRLHGWAQVRIMARAMVGLGQVRDSEWEVRC